MRSGGLLLGLATTLASCQAPPTHQGPVTTVIRVDDAVFSCSQSALHTGTRWLRPPFRPFAIAANATSVLVAGGDPAERGRIAILDHNGARLQQRDIGDDLIYAVDLRPDGTQAALGGADGTVQLIEVPSLASIRQLARHTAPCRAVRFTDDGRILATGGRDGLIHLNDLAETRHRTIADHTAGVASLLFRGDRLYSGAEDGKVRIHAGTQLLRTYQGMRQPVVDLALRDGQVVAGLRDGRILALAADDDSYREIARVPAPLFALATAADGQTLVAGVRDGVLSR